ncbi:MAG: YbaB/EbfC family nucleoid-associated protein [Planctomycetes bacterium]|nr:YbaB/EbfC family nucleoid-associated protein [Planctomycetota bacterium]
MSGTFGDMGNLLKQAQEMHKQIEKAREELRKASIEGSAGGGAVKVVVNGEGMLTRLTIQRELASSGDAGLLEASVLAAVRDGLTKAATMREERLSRISGGLSLPGLF